jgi:eukaryotic-like serine/threonine-protein kinase
MVQTRLPSRYRVLEEVGQGGMAVVYRAQDETLKREVAIKVLHAHLLAEPESKARLEREAQAVAKLHHDNILQVFDYSGGDSLSSYIVTEFIDGQTLKQFLSARKTALPEVAAIIAIELGTALAHAHSLGIIHRDVKPENVMVRKDGILKLMDFGVAQILDLERMTLTGQLLGSPAYMAPELFEGKPLDFRTDVFSVGIMLYQMATGALPFSGRNPHEVLKRIAEARFADPRTLNRLVADRLARIIGRALAKKPDERYPTVSALVEDLKVYVKDAGLDDPHEEVRRYFVDPEGYEASLPERVIAGLVATGRREQTARKLARALECWNRALALDPRNTDVLRELNRIEGRRRVYRTGVVIGGAAVLAVMIWGAFKLAHEDVPAGVRIAMGGPKEVKPKQPPAKATPPAREMVMAAKPTPTHDRKPPPRAFGRSAAPAPSPHDEPRAAEPERRPKAPAPIRTFTIAPTPKLVKVFLDGVPMFDTDSVDKNKLEVPWDGPHKLSFVNEHCCNRLDIEVGPDKPHKLVSENKILAVLEPKPATVTVQLQGSHPPDVMIEVLEVSEDGIAGRRVAVKNNEALTINFTDASEYRKSLEVSVYSGSKKDTQRVTIGPGDKKTVPVTVAVD